MRPPFDAPTDTDVAAVSEQLQRPARGVLGVAARARSGEPTVVATAPRLDDGTPFPTLYYLSHPVLTGAVSTLEADGTMAALQQRLHDDVELQRGYAAAHEAFLADRATLGEVPEIAGVSSGGMPERVKCLHAVVAHSLAAGPGLNPIGDLAIGLLLARFDDVVPYIPDSFEPVASDEV